MANTAWLIVTLVVGFAGVAVLRTSWSRAQRSRVMNLAGWSLILVAALVGAILAGAWGIAVAALSPMGGALILLALSAIRSAPAKVRAGTSRERTTQADRVPARFGPRCLTFLMVAVLAAAFGLGIAIASAGLVLLCGATKSDAYATAFFMMPLAWSVLAFALLMIPHRQRQLKILAIASIPTWPCLAAGILS